MNNFTFLRHIVNDGKTLAYQSHILRKALRKFKFELMESVK